MQISKAIQAYCAHRRARYSPGRETVADMLQVMDRKATGEEIWLELSQRGYRISESAVYVHLRWLTDNGFARKCKGQGRMAEYFLTRSGSAPVK